MADPTANVDEPGVNADARDARAVIPYGPPPPWYRQRVWIKLMVGLLILAGSIFSIRLGVRAASVWLRNRAIAREQHVMLTFSQPKTTVVYEEDQARGQALLTSGSGYRQFTRQHGNEETDVWGTPVMFVRPRGFPAGVRVDYLGDAGLFLHARTSPTGHERIVVLGEPSIFYFCRHYRQIHFVYSVGMPGVGRGVLPVFRSFIPRVVALKGNERLRMSAGQSDPADLSHWTIGYELNDQLGTIDGYLQDDDSIILQARDGPLFGRIVTPPLSEAEPKCVLPHE